MTLPSKWGGIVDGSLEAGDTALTNGQILVGNASGVAADVAMSGDALIANTGAVTVQDLTLGSDAQGCIPLRGASEYDVLQTKTSGQILVGSGTTLASVAVSGDATLAANGALSLDKDMIQVSTVDIATADVKTLNATPVVLVDHSALVSAGTIAAGDVIVFLGGVLNVNGGAANYDNNENTTINYQTAGGGATVSTTVANFLNGAADGALMSIKQLTTDIAYEADQDLVIKCSASPYSAAGDRDLRVTIWWRAFTPA